MPSPEPSSRLTQHLAGLRSARKKALVVYVTAGDPDLDQSIQVAIAAIDAGADVIELGVPFSDPVADGPVIQRAMLRALGTGGGFDQTLRVVEAVRAQRETPIVVFGYLSPLLWLGLEESYRRVANAGGDAVLIVDAPYDEAADVHTAARTARLDSVSLVTPTTDAARVRAIARQASGFVYVVSMTGVTGGQVASVDHLASTIAIVRQETVVPICIGFGIRDAAAARRAATMADGVVVGSAVVDAVERGMATRDCAEQVARVVGELRRGLDAPGGST